MGVFLLTVGLILFIGLVVVHELGHFIVARRNGVEVEEFGLFFPPKIWGHKIKARKGKKGFLFTINALPLGGFVRLKGEHDADTAPGSFGAASLGAKTKIMLAGVGMNLLAAFVLFAILAWVGMPQLISNQFTVKSDTKIIKNEVLIGSVEPGSPAARAGLKSYDQIVSIQAPSVTYYNKTGTKPLFYDWGNKPQAVTSVAQLPRLTKRLAGQPVKVTYKQSGKTLTATAMLRTKQQAKDGAYLGVAPNEFKLQRSTWSAPVVAAGLIKQFTVLTFKGLGSALGGVGSIIAGAATGNHAARETGQTQASSQVSGPVGIFFILKDGSALGYQLMLMIVAVISLTLAIMNVLPIPVLDGGKLFIMYIARAFRKRVSERFENWTYGASFILLLALMALITDVDVRRFF